MSGLEATKIVQAAGCPECKTKLRYRFGIRVSAVRQIDDVAERLMHSETLAGAEDGYKTNAAQCPCCQQFFQLLLEVKVVGVIALAAEDVPGRVAKDAPKQPLPHERKLMEELDEAGLLYSFKQAAVRELHSVPANMVTYFTTWLRLSVPMKVPAPVVAIYKNEFNASVVEFWQSTRIACVVADGEIRSFVTRTVIEEQGKALKEAPKRVSNIQPTEIWRKTRFGYVTGRGFYMAEMRKRASGDFAKAANL